MVSHIKRSLTPLPSALPSARCYNFLYVLKGAPSARQADRPEPVSRRMRRPSTESVDERHSVPWRPRVMGTLAAGGRAAWPAASSAIAHRRGPLPAAPMPRTPPQHAPAVTHRGSCAPRAGRAGSSRARCAYRRAKGHRQRAGTPRIVRVDPSTRKGTRRSFPNAPQKPLRRKHLRDPPLRAEPLPTRRA
jgi:hypothetical protein